jgi:hypothetical protein
MLILKIEQMKLLTSFYFVAILSDGLIALYFGVSMTNNFHLRILSINFSSPTHILIAL